MGYESRLFVVNKSNTNTNVAGDGKTWKWGDLLATFNLSCVHDECNELWQGNDTDCTFYTQKPNGEYGCVTKDCYGKPLKEHSVNETIRILMKGEVVDHYRRYSAPIAYLMAIDQSEWEQIVVLHYGY